MISVIICSVDPTELQNVKANIAATIGVPHEVIGIDNRGASRGICAVYNEGAKRAVYPVLCFMHEDIEMKTRDWGRGVLKLFEQNERLGLIGIAGGGYKSLSPSSWYNYFLQENGGFYCNVIQGFKYTGKPEMHDYRNPRNEPVSKVACVDGCWFCTKKEVTDEFPFDEKLLKKFHGYDLDFAISLSTKYEAVVTFQVLLRHFSEGNFDQTWAEEIIKVHEKWAAVLPLNVDQLPETHLKRIERDALEVFIQQQVNAGKFSTGRLARLLWSTRKSRVATFSFPYKLISRLLKMKPQPPNA